MTIFHFFSFCTKLWWFFLQLSGLLCQVIVVVDPVERMGENAYIVVLETSRLFRPLFQKVAANRDTKGKEKAFWKKLAAGWTF